MTSMGAPIATPPRGGASNGGRSLEVPKVPPGLDLEGSGGIKHALCTEYDVGAGIGWHRDKKHFDQVFGLSLASACKLRFRRKVGNKWERFTLNAQPRSLYVMTGASRHIWEHSIPPVETPRYSITFRTMIQARASDST